MKLSELYESISQYSPQTYGNTKADYDLQTIRLYTKNQTMCNETILYMCDISMLPSPDFTGHFAIVCYGLPIDFSLYNNSSFTIIHIDTTLLSYEQLFNLLQEELTEMQQITAGMHIMANALFSDKGLQHLIDTGATIFGNPLYLVDLQHKYLAISSGITPSNDFFHSENEAGYVSTEGILYIRSQHLDEKIRKNNGPYYFFNELANHGMLVDTVLIQGIEVGHLMIQEADHPFNEFDATLLRRFSKLVSIELQKDSVFTNNRGVMYSYFLSDLLKNPSCNTTVFRERLSALGYNLKENLYILVIPSNNYHSCGLRLEAIVQHLQRIFTGSIYAIYDESIVFLISKELYQGIGEHEETELTNFLTANHLCAGISNYFTNLSDAGRFYQQALDAVRIGSSIHEEVVVCHYQKTYIYQLLETYKKTDSKLQYLVHPGFMQLHQYDAKHATDLLHTLRTYLEHPGQPAKVAQLLHIHKNTLIYRMGKIKEITQCDFQEGEDYMNFELSYKIMEYLHML